MKNCKDVRVYIVNEVVQLPQNCKGRLHVQLLQSSLGTQKNHVIKHRRHIMRGLEPLTSAS